MCVGDLMAWNMAPLIDPGAGGSIIKLGETFSKAEAGIKDVELVIEGHGNVNTWQGMKNYGEFMRTLVETARQGLAKQQTTQQALDELKKNTKFAIFLGNERLKDVEYGDTPSNRALINLNVAYQELRGEPVTIVLRTGAVDWTREGERSATGPPWWRRRPRRSRWAAASCPSGRTASEIDCSLIAGAKKAPANDRRACYASPGLQDIL